MRNHPTDHDGDVVAAQGRQLVAQLRHQGQVPGGQRGDTHHVHVVLHGLAGRFGRCGKQRADIHIEPQVGERGGDHLLAPVVAVLADLGHQDPGSTPGVGGEDVHPFAHGAHPVSVPDLA